MASSAGHIRPGRYLAFFVFIIVALYALVFFTGNGQPTPKLGIDLQGGTRVTLTAQTVDGKEPSKEQLDQAREIIETRVNGLGVSGAEVVLDGNNIRITVPGKEGDQAKMLGQTAKLGMRSVITEQPAAAQPGQQPGQLPGQTGQQPGQGGTPQGAVAPGPDSGSTTPQSATEQARQPSDDPSPPGDDQAGAPANANQRNAEQIRKERQLRQSENQQVQMQALTQLDCSKRNADPLMGNDDPKKPLVTCSRDGKAKYVLGPVFIDGQQISDANATAPQDGSPGFVVNLDFKSQGADTWAKYTAKNVGKQAAFVLDTQVVSAPSINQAIPGGNTQISGDFNQQQAQDLANVLKYGSLPLAFESSDAATVSATLGLASLQAGLIAGGIGLALVFLYCLFYYRMLGMLTILSLGLSFTIVYGVLVLLGRWIGYSLDLAGVAGLIIAIGVTADSFVVFFERLKDEVREGRTFRSAVPRGWLRARRTILSADAVLFLGAAVLYILAVGEVRGFAFTLGLSTVLDLIVVFLVTHPLVSLAAKSKTLSSPRFSGLGGVQRLAAERQAAKRLRSGPTVKEA
ncbi:MAG: protein translocase subunit SecD [Pseudonocardiaceae bacterium]|nr:protein translocase subunit SecD [Pseudonocardiaceae bacterium]